MSDDGATVTEKRGRGRPAKDKKKEEAVEENEKAPSPAAKKRGRAAKEAPKKDIDAGGDDEVMNPSWWPKHGQLERPPTQLESDGSGNNDSVNFVNEGLRAVESLATMARRTRHNSIKAPLLQALQKLVSELPPLQTLKPADAALYAVAAPAQQTPPAQDPWTGVSSQLDQIMTMAQEVLRSSQALFDRVSDPASTNPPSIAAIVQGETPAFGHRSRASHRSSSSLATPALVPASYSAGLGHSSHQENLNILTNDQHFDQLPDKQGPTPQCVPLRPSTPVPTNPPLPPSTPAAPCLICKQDKRRGSEIHCRSCRSFWSRLEAKQHTGSELPTCPTLSHLNDTSLLRACAGCRRYRYEETLLRFAPSRPLRVEPITAVGVSRGATPRSGRAKRRKGNKAVVRGGSRQSEERLCGEGALDATPTPPRHS